jgi:fumarylacetoacetase
VATGEFRQHAFGFLLVNDWSARDLQTWEMQPLGPFLGKSFATSVSPWVVPVAALEAARVLPPRQDPPPLAYLDCAEPWGLDLALQITVNGQLVARPAFRSMYWTPPQQLAHATVNGAPLRTGDLFASGTVSGPDRDQLGCLLELTRDGAEPITLADGSQRAFLEDGDEVVIRATAPGTDGAVVSLGEVRGRVIPAA